MKYNLILLLSVFTIIMPRSVFAKENKDLEKANYYYNHWAYHEAIPFYEKVADQLNDPTVYTELGDCYKATGSLDKAAAWYDKAVKTKGCSPAVMLRYGQVLMQLTQYKEAEKWFNGYQKSLKTIDKRVANLIAGCEYAQKSQTGIPAGTALFASINTEGSEFAPTLWKGKLVFTSDTVIDLKKKKDNWTGNAYYNIYSVTCDNTGSCNTDIAKVADAKALNIKYHSGPCTFSADGKEMYFTRSKFNDKFFSKRSVSNKDSVVLQEIMIANDYDDSNKEFKNVVPFNFNSDDYTVEHPSVSPNGKMLAFSSNMPKGAGGFDIYVSKKVGKGDWMKPQNVGMNINTEGEEVFPYWADDTTLYFSSDGHAGLGGLDIYRSTWNEKTNTFSKPENAGAPMNSSYDDISLALFSDGRSTYFSSNRPAQKGGDNIYFYKREQLFLQLVLTDSNTKQPVRGLKISLSSTKDKRELTDNNGNLYTQLYPESEYTININKDGYISRQITVMSTSSKETDTLIRNVLMVKTVQDTIPVAKPIEQVVVRHESVMDSPGVREFELDKIYEVGHFYYDYDKYELTSAHKSFLDTMMVQMKRHPTMRIEIHSHTDCRGSDEYNRVLSNKRALSVVNYLVQHGISRKRLEYIGYGSSMPKVKCLPSCESCSEDQHYLNRILEFKVLHL